MNNLIIISGPSGAGKDSLIENLTRKIPMGRIITTTSRAMRPSETEGNPYYFLSPHDFEQKIQDNEFLEWAHEENNNYYGVTYKEIERIKNINQLFFWKIGLNGVKTIKQKYPNIPTILISAPNKELEQRLKERDNPSEKYLKERLDIANDFLKNKKLFNYEIINRNNKLAKADEEFLKVIKKNFKIKETL